MSKGFIAALLILAGSISALAQMSPEEAQQQMDVAAAAHRAAATQPDALVAQIAELKAVIADQATQIDALKAKIAKMAEVPSQNLSPHVHGAGFSKPTFESRWKERGDIFLSHHVLGPSQYSAAMTKAKQIDEAIDAACDAANVSSDMRSAMHEGEIQIGMPEDCIKTFMSLILESDNARGRIYSGYILDIPGIPNQASDTIITSAGTVTEIDHHQEQ